MSFWKKFFVEEDGQDMVEYGLIIGLVVLMAVAAYQGFSGKLNAGIGAQATQIETYVK